MLIRFDMGDWSGDGHSITSPYLLESDVSPAALGEAYWAGCEVLGFDLAKEVCSRYEERTISDEHLDRLIELGWDAKFRDGSTYNKNYGGVEKELLWSMFLFVLRLGKPDLKLTEVETQYFHIYHDPDYPGCRNNLISLGYGLFS